MKRPILYALCVANIIISATGCFINVNHLSIQRSSLPTSSSLVKSSSSYGFDEFFNNFRYIDVSRTNASLLNTGIVTLPPQDIIELYRYTGNLDNVSNIEYSNNRVFIAEQSKGMSILNVSNPTAPQLIARSGIGNNDTKAFDVEGNLVYVADGANGLKIMNVSDLLDPSLINTWSNGLDMTDVLIDEDSAFISVQNSGIEVLNISNPLSLNKIGNWTNHGSPCKPVLKGSFLFAADEANGLEIIDFSLLSSPSKKATLNLHATPYSMQIRNDYLYMANGIDGLKIIDISDLYHPVLTNTVWGNGSVIDVLLVDEYAFLGTTHGFEVVDVSNPVNPAFIYSWNENSAVSSIDINDGILYLSLGSNGVAIMNFSRFITPKLLSRYAPNVNSNGIELDGSFGYLCSIQEGSYRGGLYIVNLTYPADIQPLGAFQENNLNIYDVKIQGNSCYVAAYNKGLICLDVTNKSHVVVKDRIGDSLNFSQGIALHDDFAFVADGFDGINIYNISNPANIQLVTKYNNGGTYYDVKVRGNYAFMARGYEGVEIVNISDIMHIQFVSAYKDAYNNSQSIELWDNHLLVADRFDGLEILDISDINNPRKIGQYSDAYNRAVDVEVLGSLAVVADREGGAEIINMSDPTNPSKIASFTDSYNNTRGCAITTRFIFCADSHDGLQVVQYRAHLFDSFKASATCQSLELDTTDYPIINGTFIIQAEILDGTSIECYLSNDGGSNWEHVQNGTVHLFASIGSSLKWKLVLASSNESHSPMVTRVQIQYSTRDIPQGISTEWIVVILTAILVSVLSIILILRKKKLLFKISKSKVSRRNRGT